MSEEITKGESKEVKSHDSFVIAEDGTLSFEGLSCEILDNAGSRVGPVGNGSSKTVSKGMKCYVQQGKVTLR